LSGSGAIHAGPNHACGSGAIHAGPNHACGSGAYTGPNDACGSARGGCFLNTNWLLPAH
jgi:hypothetical protein